MLSESLQKLMNNPSRGKNCKLGNIINSLDKETSELLVEALKSDTSTMGLVRVLKDEGMPVSREYLAEKRSDCFKGLLGTSRCCLQQNTETEKSK